MSFVRILLLVDAFLLSFKIIKNHLFIACRKECEELEADERNIDTKIKKKQDELERTEKRLKSLENVRPQFMDEVTYTNLMVFVIKYAALLAIINGARGFSAISLRE